MIQAILQAVELMQHELLLFSAVWLLVGAADDLAIDLIWIVRWAYRRVTIYSKQAPLRFDQLALPKRPGLLAIFIPTWREANVIGTMLVQCSQKWRGGCTRYHIYVGCYPNDPNGIAEVLRAAANDPSIRLILLPHPGPTTKADCLNRLWRALLTDELAGGYKAKAIVLHDAEDSVHVHELAVFDRMIEKSIAVQLPVLPVAAEQSKWISGHYCDEFAEAHGKNMVVREAIGAALPLAGVGCAIDRNVLGRIAFEHAGQPFDNNSLTEDYELGLKIGAAGGRSMMARIMDDEGQMIGTKAYFPDSLDASVRQKARWLTGIALAGWDRLGWSGNWAEHWMRLHDRRSIFAAIVLMAAYVCVALTMIVTVADFAGVYQSSALPHGVTVMLGINAVLLLWRTAVRAAFVAVQYGWREAVLSVPRSIIGNIISIMAARRACMSYFRHCVGAPLTWDKTTHHVVPQIVLRK